MSNPEKLITEATQAKEEGNQAYSIGDYQKAIKNYQNALRVVNKISVKNKQKKKDSSESKG